MADERNWTSFNAGKMFYHIDRWKSIVPGRPCPPPALITVDPSNSFHDKPSLTLPISSPAGKVPIKNTESVPSASPAAVNL